MSTSGARILAHLGSGVETVGMTVLGGWGTYQIEAQKRSHPSVPYDSSLYSVDLSVQDSVAIYAIIRGFLQITNALAIANSKVADEGNDDKKRELAKIQGFEGAISLIGGLLYMAYPDFPFTVLTGMLAGSSFVKGVSFFRTPVTDPDKSFAILSKLIPSVLEVVSWILVTGRIPGCWPVLMLTGICSTVLFATGLLLQESSPEHPVIENLNKVDLSRKRR